MHRLKPISREGIPAALQKAERYRLLNEPMAAESICRDVLAAEADNQAALVMLVLTLTDQMAHSGDMTALVREARETLARVTDAYKRAYYGGIIAERRAKAQLRHESPGAGEIAYDWFAEAMQLYAEAEQLRPKGNDEALLRWNTCARILQRSEHVRPSAEREYEPSFE